MSADYSRFDPLTGEVSVNGLTSRLRPKTYLLAQYLAERADQVISKDELLSALWAGAIVEEQAIFQSINEIRKAFEPHQVIKTYPKRGYVWLVPQHPSIETISTNEVVFHNTKKTPFYPLKQLFNSYTLISLITLLIVLFVMSQYRVSPPPLNASQSVDKASYQALLIIPFETETLDDAQKWLRYGAMEAVIRQFPASQAFTSFQMTDALDILKRLPDDNDNVAAYFNVSGATHIVKAQLSGVPGEYNLNYTLYQLDSRTQGTLHGSNLEQLIQQLVTQVAYLMNTRLKEASEGADEQFKSALMFNAIEYLAKHDLSSAIAFLKSTLVISPDNIAASYLLGSAYAQLGAFNDAIKAAQHGLSVITEQDSNYLSRLLYIKGISLQAVHNVEGVETLKQALTTAQTQGDWLYVAYSKAMLAQYHISAGQLEIAHPLLQSSLAYQQMLNCPMGIAQGYLDLVDYHLASGDINLANANLEMANDVVTQKKLYQVMPLIRSKKAEFDAFIEKL